MQTRGAARRGGRIVTPTAVDLLATLLGQSHGEDPLPLCGVLADVLEEDGDPRAPSVRGESLRSLKDRIYEEWCDTSAEPPFLGATYSWRSACDVIDRWLAGETFRAARARQIIDLARPFVREARRQVRERVYRLLADDCLACAGTGKRIAFPFKCPRCAGRGWLPREVAPASRR